MLPRRPGDAKAACECQRGDDGNRRARRARVRRKPGDERADHLSDVALPMLFLQGANDALASLDLLCPVVQKLGRRASLALFADADHSFHVPAKSGRKDADVLAEVLDAAVAWMRARA